MKNLLKLQLLTKNIPRHWLSRVYVGDATNLVFPEETFDTVIGQRILINLTNWERQQRAIREVSRVIKSDGSYIACEVTHQGYEEVNRLRKEFGLPSLERYWHNCYLDEEKFLKFLEETGFKLEE